MSAKDGGPAFPTLTQVQKFVGHQRSTAGVRPTYQVSTELAHGMSLRDYFAAYAMTGYVAQAGPASDEDGDFVARYAYEIADAMLAERAKVKS